jgi:hypothetical protein
MINELNRREFLKLAGVGIVGAGLLFGTPSYTHAENKNYYRFDEKKGFLIGNETLIVIRNKRTGQIVEIRAASSYHACNIIGWKHTQVKLLEEKEIDLSYSFEDKARFR